MTLQILFIRHGETDWNAAGRWQGHADPPLNANGRAQAQALAARLARRPIDHVISSDLTRARETAEFVATAVALPVTLDAAWRERHVGDFSGLTTPEIKQTFPDAWANMQRGILNPPNGETFIELHTRVTAAFTVLTERFDSGVVAVISHGGTLNAVISHVVGVPPDRFGGFSLRGNTGVSIVEVRNGRSRLTLLNDICHLE